MSEKYQLQVSQDDVGKIPRLERFAESIGLAIDILPPPARAVERGKLTKLLEFCRQNGIEVSAVGPSAPDVELSDEPDASGISPARRQELLRAAGFDT